jgi:hypothetical protein
MSVIEKLKEHFVNYEKTGIITNITVASFLENDVYAIMEFQDSELFKLAPEIIKWLRENLSQDAWGSKEIVEAYQSSKGIKVAQ